MIQGRWAGWLAVATLPCLAGCGGRPGAAAAPARLPDAARVVIRGTAYLPPAVTVPAGGRVVWRFEDSAPHTVTADANAFGSSPNGQATGSFEHVFPQPGVFAYHCDFHPTMHGTVTVRQPAR